MDDENRELVNEKLELEPDEDDEAVVTKTPVEVFSGMLTRFRERCFPDQLFNMAANQFGITPAELVRLEEGDGEVVLPTDVWLTNFSEKCQVTEWEHIALQALLETARKKSPQTRSEIPIEMQDIVIQKSMPAANMPVEVFWWWLNVQLKTHDSSLWALTKATGLSYNKLNGARRDKTALPEEDRDKIGEFVVDLQIAAPQEKPERKGIVLRKQRVQPVKKESKVPLSEQPEEAEELVEETAAETVEETQEEIAAEMPMEADDIGLNTVPRPAWLLKKAKETACTKWLIAHLREKKMTPRELADKLKVPWLTMSFWLYGINYPGKYIKQLEEIFGEKVPPPIARKKINKKIKATQPESKLEPTLEPEPMLKLPMDFSAECLMFSDDLRTIFKTRLSELTGMASVVVNTRITTGHDEEAKLQALHLNVLAIDWSLGQALAALLVSESKEDMIVVSMTKNAVLDMRYAFNAVCLVYSIKPRPIDYQTNIKRMLGRYNQLCELLGAAGQEAQAMSQGVFQFSEAVLNPNMTKEAIQKLFTDLVCVLPQLTRDN